MSKTIGEVLRDASDQWPQRPAVRILGEPGLSYAALEREACAFAATLQRDFPAADHVALLMPNSVRWLIALYGCAMAGKVAVLVNPRLTTSELTYQITQSQSTLVIANGDSGSQHYSELFASLDNMQYSHSVIWTGHDEAPGESVNWDNWVTYSLELDETKRADPSETAVIIYTSGTTSQPKGVELSHEAVVGNAARVGRRFNAGPDDRVFSAGPFFHSGGLTMHILLCAVFGACAYSMPAFDVEAIVEMVEREGITIYNGIETLFLRLAQAPGFSKQRLRSIRTGWATGTPAILDSIANDIGIPGVICVYGISEAAPNVLMSDWDDSPEHRLHTVGHPQSDTQCRVVDPGTGEDLPPGETGELLVKGPGVMNGYFNKPRETRETFSDGWLRTGDLVMVREDGYFCFAGRAKDIVRTGGENVSCAEVEDAIYAVSDAELAAVFGVADSVFGEIVVAAVTPRREKNKLGEAALIERLRQRLAGYKVPKRIIQVSSMPLTQSGKVQKAQLREQISGDEVIG
jgi:acyl-CoA synthetase (AMP-forming)/AMP-acid ligase II